LQISGLEVEVEYEDGIISQFPVERAQVQGGAVVIQLGLKHTDCLAKDVCLPASGSDACCSGSACC
jgi:hypothetical protein